jgi:hypothetical protein
MRFTGKGTGRSDNVTLGASAAHSSDHEHPRRLTVAQKVQVLLTDDIDGTEADETIQFALDGISYEIDLSAANAETLREVLAPYVESGRRLGGRSSRRSGTKMRPATERIDMSNLRTWARENGYQISDRGRVSGEVRAAYEAAHA